jgi:hypothetical protein
MDSRAGFSFAQRRRQDEIGSRRVEMSARHQRAYSLKGRARHSVARRLFPAPRTVALSERRVVREKGFEFNHGEHGGISSRMNKSAGSSNPPYHQFGRALSMKAPWLGLENFRTIRHAFRYSNLVRFFR